MDWDRLRVFHTVGLCKSLTEAGNALGLSQSAVSRRIAGLEEKMGVPLFHRHARGLLLSEQGEILFRTVSEMVGKLEAVELTLAEATAKPKGPFRLSVPATFGSIWLASQMKEYTDLYPDIQVTLLCEDRESDLARREADAAIRFYASKQPDVVQVPMMTLRNSLYASNDYVRQYGLPKTVADLKKHKLLGFDAAGGSLPFPQVNWLFEGAGRDFEPFFRVNSLLAMRTAVKQGMGIAALPDYLMHRTRHISRILPEIEAPATEAFYLFPVELKNSKRINVFRQFVIQKIADSNF